MAGDGASAGPASAVMGFVGKVVEKVTAPIDALNLAVGKATYAFVLMLPSFPAARLWSDLVFQFGHSHPHPPTFGFPLPSFGPILASGSQSVLINGLPAARCGDLGLSVWCGGYVPIFEVLTGSSHVFIGGARASRMLFDLTFHCLPEPFAGLGKVAKVQKFLTVGEILGAGIGAGMSLLGAAAAQEQAGAAQNEASDAAAQAEALALAAAESAAIEAQMQAMMAGLSADDAANRAAAAGVAASTAIAQAAADIAALAMSILMGKDPGIGFPLGMIITGSANVRIGGFPMPGWMTILRGLLKMLQPVLRRVQMRLPAGRLKKALCFLTGDPVEVASGRVVTSEVDFEFPGRIPIVFERSYDTSSIDYEGPLGWGWTHTFDQHLWYDRRQRAMIWRDEEGRVVGFDPLDIGERMYHPLEKVWLERTGEKEYVLKGQQSQLRYTFGSVDASAKTDTNGLREGHSETAAFRLLEIRDRNNNRLTMEYNGGRLSAIDDGAGLRLLLSYDLRADGRIRLKEVRQSIDRDRSAMLVSYGYDTEGDLSAVTDPNQVPFRYYYDSHLMVRRTTRNGLSFYFEYQGEGREAKCVHTWGDGGIYERWITYQPRARVTVVRDSLGGETIYHFNEIDQVTRVRDAEGGTRKYEYGQAGELLVDENELGRKRVYSYDDYYNCTGVTQEDGTTRRVTYDEWSQPVLIEDEMGGQWRRDFDDRGNVVTAIDALGSRSEFKYDARGDLIELRDAVGSVTQAEWDQSGQIRASIGASGDRTSYLYDNQRQLVEERDEGLGLSVRYDYDRTGLLSRVREIDPQGRTISAERYSYDPEGNLIRYVDGLGNATQYRYAGFNRVVERTDALGYRRRIEYDTEERIVRIENERGESYRFEYDLLERVISEVSFDGGVREFEYDRTGRLNNERDPAGRETQYVRDPAGRVLKRIRADLSSVEYEYDPCGRLIAASNTGGEIRFDYDAASRLTREEQYGNVIEYEYDAEGQRLARRLTPGTERGGIPPSIVEYRYDADGSLNNIRAGGQDVHYRLDRTGRLTARELPNGLEETYRYDSNGWLAGQKLAHRRSAEDLGRRAYRWNAAGSLTEVDDSRQGTRRYAYDAVEQLQQVERVLTIEGRFEDPTGAGGRSGLRHSDLPPERRLWRGSDDDSSRKYGRDERQIEDFRFDGDGNLLERKTNRGVIRSFAYGRGDRLERADDTRFIYDSVGNLIEKRHSDGRWIGYEYDVEDQLVAVTSSDRGRIEFTYDPFGRRRAKRTEQGEVGFIWDGDVLLGEQHTDRARGSVVERTEYLQVPDSFVPSARLQWTPDGQAELQPYHVDHLGAPRAVTDRNGKLVWEADYDEYGRAVIREGGSEQPIRFQGQYEDGETGLHYNFFRYYDPETGRYITRDPIGLEGGFNCYAYTPNPVNWVDPLGLSCTRIKKEGNKTILEIYDKFAPGSRASRQLRRFVKAWNEEIARNGGSMTKRRVPLSAAQERMSARWKRQMQSRFPGRFSGKVVGHTPDAIMGGRIANGRAMALSQPVNSYLGGVAGGVPGGTRYHEVRLYRR